VGYSQVNPSTITTLVEQWNGTKWSIMSTPNPLGFEASYLNGVSCTGATACTAVGNSFTGTVFSPLVEQWNGTKWSIVSSAKPVGAATSYLVSVACTGATACWAVGYWSGGTVADATLVEKWNGTKWTIVSSPNRPGLNFLSGVACTGATACTAVGNSDHPPISTLVEQWNGTKWSIVSSPNPVGSSNSALQGVSCHGLFCVAVGYANPGNPTSTLVEQT
jgi:beta-xylosidase